jgi:hypothetical protein
MGSPKMAGYSVSGTGSGAANKKLPTLGLAFSKRGGEVDYQGGW